MLILYANVGPELIGWGVDIAETILTRLGAITLPDNVQYAWPHGRMLYVATSGQAEGRDSHHLLALRIDGATGGLAPQGGPVKLPSRPIHLSTDPDAQFVLVAFNKPSALRIFQIAADGGVGPEIPQSAPLDAGVFAHQVRVTPDGRRAILVARGNPATATQPEEPGALKIFGFDAGRLTPEATIGGPGFGPRHLDFHPGAPWAYLSIELQNEIGLLRLSATPDLLFRQTTLAVPRANQAAGPIHVHPNGRFVYVANRADRADGENSVAAFAIDPATGALSPIQREDTRSIHPRTFAIDPSGRLLIAQHNRPGALSLFRIAEDGRLTFARTDPVEVGASTMFWAGMVETGPT